MSSAMRRPLGTLLCLCTLAALAAVRGPVSAAPADSTAVAVTTRRLVVRQ